MRANIVVIGLVIGVFGIIVMAIGISEVTKFDPDNIDPDEEADYNMYVLMEYTGFIMMIIGVIFFILGIIPFSKATEQKPKVVYKTKHVHYCPECRDRLVFRRKRRMYYCRSCETYPLDEEDEEDDDELPPPPPPPPPPKKKVKRRKQPPPPPPDLK
jgi:hypothetical protein